ncbi:MAG: hypothetical protein AAFP69_09770 [Planctomycetota bacterium]
MSAILVLAILVLVNLVLVNHAFANHVFANPSVGILAAFTASHHHTRQTLIPHELANPASCH